jgi:hypothetical protein
MFSHAQTSEKSAFSGLCGEWDMENYYGRLLAHPPNST